MAPKLIPAFYSVEFTHTHTNKYSLRKYITGFGDCQNHSSFSASQLWGSHTKKSGVRDFTSVYFLVTRGILTPDNLPCLQLQLRVSVEGRYWVLAQSWAAFDYVTVPQVSDFPRVTLCLGGFDRGLFFPLTYSMSASLSVSGLTLVLSFRDGLSPRSCPYPRVESYPITSAHWLSGGEEWQLVRVFSSPE